MSLAARRLLTRVVVPRSATSVRVTVTARRWAANAADEDDEKKVKLDPIKPYRPWPLDTPFHNPNDLNVWDPVYKPPSELSDQYPEQDEKVYLHELEERMATYDAKYSHSQKIKDLYNEFSWQYDDDRAFFDYGSSLASKSELEAYGPGKKINPAHYVNPQFELVSRNPYAAVTYLNGDQIRRTRGRLSRFKEVVPETDSIFKTWEWKPIVFATVFIYTSKEWFFPDGHDVKDVFNLYVCLGLITGMMLDWWNWYFAVGVQQRIDHYMFPLIQNLEKLHKAIEQLKGVPATAPLSKQLLQYRGELGEKVLQTSLANRINDILDDSVRKLEAKLSEEKATRREAEATIKRNAVALTMAHFDQNKVRDDFFKNALKEFTSGDNSKLSGRPGEKSLEYSAFEQEFNANLKIAEKSYVEERKKTNTLPWVFVPEADRKKQLMSAKQREDEFKKRVQAWAQSHNPVNNPSFA